MMGPSASFIAFTPLSTRFVPRLARFRTAPMHGYLLLALAIVAEVIATSSLKAAENFTRLWPSVFVVAGYVVAFWLLMQVMKTVPVGVTSELIRGDVFYWGPLMAGALLGSIPVAVAYSFFVEHYVSGLTGSVKG